MTLSGASSATVTADTSGNYSFAGLANGAYTVTPTKSGFTFSPTNRAVTISGANATAVNFTATAITWSISGTITGGSGATVTLSGASSATVTADTSGNYSFTGLANGAYTVTPSKSGFTFSPTNQAVTISGANATAVNFTATAITWSISGTITGGSGATVTLSGAASATVTADGSGNYTFTGLANGAYTVTPSKSGFTFSPTSQAVTISSANVTAVNFTATAITWSISGTITGGSGATVTLSGASSATVTADSSGNYTFTGLANGAYTVTPSKSGFTMNPVNRAVTISGASATAVNFTATAITWSISGTITGGSGATVTLSGAASATTTADGSGNYSFTGLANGAYTVTPSKSGFTFSPTSQAVTISSANVTAVNFTATATTWSISGTITGGSGSTVTLSGASSATVTADGSGNYTFNGLANGAYTVTPSKSGFTMNPVNRAVTISGANATAVNFTATAITWSISGTITGGNGATVTLSGAASATVTADGSGNYTFTGLANGAYTVTPSKSGFTFSPTSQAVTISSANVTAVNFTATATTWSISGTITGGSGSTVTLSGASSATVTADTSGNYSFTGLANGAYTVTPSKSGFTFSPTSRAVTVSSANATAVNFTSTAITWSISGTITGGSGATVTLSGAASATVTADSSGNYTFNGLANGAYTVTPSKSGFTFSPTNQAVTISSANATAVNFTATATTWSISGTITGGSGSTVTLSGASSATVTADSSGNYTFTGLANGAYTVTPSKSGFTFSPTSRAVTISSANATAVNFTATAITWSISGTITGGSGATVTLSGTTVSTATADASGNYSFNGLTNGAYTVTPSKTGFTMNPVNRAVTISGANATAVNFAATAITWSVSGTITGGSGATVTLSGAASATVTADGSGNYSFTGLANGAYTVTPSKSGFTLSPTSQAVTISSANVTAVNFTATAIAWSISGTIAGGSGATVTLSGAASATVTADASGNYTLDGLANGAYTVTPSKTGFTFSPASQPVTISSANVTAVNFTATAIAWSISGMITGGSGATVTLSGASSATVTADTSGNYSFTGLANGAYTVTPSKSGFTFTPSSQPVNLSGANVSAVNFTASASGPTSALSVDYPSLQYGWSGTLITSPQTVTVNISPAAAVAWTATSNQSNITVNPPSGIGSGALQISVSPGPSGVVTVTAAGATNSPQQIQVNVANVTPGLPFGSFDTPVNNTAGITGAIPVTGWALDNIELTSVGIWREPVGSEPTSPNGLVLIGNATFVPGARPDVQTTYPNSPWNYRGGWGYMLLTNFLPNPGGPLGNGTYFLHAIAVNKAGNQLDLGTRIINVDNADASTPFGTIDTPDQGGTASGNAFVNFGWALTQNPYLIPLDGSTITVLVDGVTLGHPTYNQYRADIANDFPGLANSNGAVGFFYVDTTTLANGMHTISWVVYDNGARGAGIGSRYFNVLNSGLGGTAAPADSESVVSMEGANRTPKVNQQLAPMVLDNDGTVSLEVDELSQIELPMGATSGYLFVGGQRTALPIGSTLQNGTFYWQLGPGFLGDYPMVFERSDGTELRLRVRVRPRGSPPITSLCSDPSPAHADGLTRDRHHS